jgi:esterase/lipase superfamily enzyme
VHHAALTGATGWTGQVVAHGHYGRPVLVFPSEGGSAWDFENNGLLDAVRWMVDAGRVKIYCVDSADGQTWSDQVLPWIDDDCAGDASDLVAIGCSLGAFHAANLALRHAHLFPRALCLSGSYDPGEWNAWGDRGTAAYFHNPIDYVTNLHGDHLDWLRSRVHLVLVVGQGSWEVDPTRALPSTRRFAEVLASKGIPHELDVWGHEFPHDWPSWRAQIAHHLPRLA